MDTASVPNHALLVLTLVSEGVWVAVAALLWRSHSPARVAGGPESTDLGPEPPATVNLVCHGWRVTREAAAATVIDLAARGYLTLEWVGDSFVCRFRKPPDHDRLLAFEKRVLALLRQHDVGGVAPAFALDTGPAANASRWWRDFRRQVVDDAQRRGLSRSAWDARVTTTLGALAAATIGLGGLAALASVPAREGSPWGTAFAVAYGIAIVLAITTVGLGTSNRQRDTVEGHAVAARWLGVRRALVATGSFSDIPPPGVAVWDRYLAYATALGAAPRAAGHIALGAEDDHWAWTASTGDWRRVQVRYPRLPGWGHRPRWVLPVSTATAATAAIAFVVLLRVAATAPWIAGLLLVGLAALFVWHIAAAVQAALDLRAPAEHRGRVIRLRPRPRLSFSDHLEYRQRWYLALDDGTSDSIWAWSVSSEIYDALNEGDTITAQVTRRLRHVSAVRRIDRLGRRIARTA